MSNILQHAWKPVRAGGHVKHNWEARHEDRVTRTIPEASVCVQRKPDRARCPVTSTLQHAWEPVHGRNHMTHNRQVRRRGGSETMDRR